jgi:hypothetical protein
MNKLSNTLNKSLSNLIWFDDIFNNNDKIKFYLGNLMILIRLKDLDKRKK